MTLDLNIEAIINRQDFLYRNVPRCEFCGADQVQLKLKSMPAEWKCRVCKRHFKYEPAHYASNTPGVTYASRFVGRAWWR